MTHLKNLLKFVVIKILTIEARFVLRKFKPRIIAISGSVGKTSTKDAIYSVLEHSGFVRKSDKSFNGDIGVPLTILGLHNGWFDPIAWTKNVIKGFLLYVFNDPYPKVLILEIGADKPGEIKNIVSWVKPHVAVGTKFPKVPVHVEFFKSPEAVNDEDALVLQATRKNGVVILNFDNEEMLAYRSTLGQQIVTYGMKSGADVLGSNCRFTFGDSGFPSGIAFDVTYKGVTREVFLTGALGLSHVYPLLAAIAVGVTEGVLLEIIVQNLAKHETPPGRMRILEGINHSVIIDDTYNASPVAMQEAIRTIDELPPVQNGRKIFVLGDMLELGSYTANEHVQAGGQVAKVADMLIVVGVRSRLLADGAVGAGMPESSIVRFDDSRKAGEYLKSVLGKGDIVLIKGSQSIRMERAVEMVMAHPEDKERLLVRQDPVWLSM